MPINYRKVPSFFFLCLILYNPLCPAWIPDNGNGTFTNPLFYEEFSDPDMIRVGSDFYLTGTTMHSMPGLPILHSKDLVNWEFVTYVFDQLDLGPEFRLKDGREIYGQGIWAPCFRYHNGTYYIFSNINRHGTQMFRAANPAGPWTRTQMNGTFHDLSVLFDDDGKVYIIWGYQGINLAQLNDKLTDIIPDTKRMIIEPGSGMGEGVHFYKVNGKYFITSAWFAGRMRMPCARSDTPEGPYEVNMAISMDEDFGLAEGYRLRGAAEPPFEVTPANTHDGGRMSLHQGGVVNTPSGQWWGFSMMDFNSIGRLTCLSPITWKDGWPYFGLEDNLKRTPRTWIKPDTGYESELCKPYERNDDFSDTKLKPIWQWNHIPLDRNWSLTTHPGYLRLKSLPASDLWWARNTLTQRSIGPMSTPTVTLDISGMQNGDNAGLALMNRPYAWIGIRQDGDTRSIVQYNQLTDKTVTIPCKTDRIWLRADCNFLTDKATFSYSIDGKTFNRAGGEFTMVYQLKTFQGIRYSLFHYNTTGAGGGYADFDEFTVDEPYSRGLMRPIPYGEIISLKTHGTNSSLIVKNDTLTTATITNKVAKIQPAHFKVINRKLGRVALQYGEKFISVMDTKRIILKAGTPDEDETFQWMENVYGDLILMSLKTHCYLRINPDTNAITADHPGPKPDRKDGSCFIWKSDKNVSIYQKLNNPY